MTIHDVMELMTPQEILDLGEFTAKPILPEKFTTFESIVTRRGSIRNLDLLPVKTDAMRSFYNRQDKNALALMMRHVVAECARKKSRLSKHQWIADFCMIKKSRMQFSEEFLI